MKMQYGGKKKLG